MDKMTMPELERALLFLGVIAEKNGDGLWIRADHYEDFWAAVDFCLDHGFFVQERPVKKTIVVWSG